ncbi:hypothetical protein E8E13_003915 [Curvularia kusanoi]|uniref:Uncharacterized protein n=1 Tax=Curvularia kusanoi TaxID=90978 RepID=A0A9P4THU7_CURKU|nr:hypothetical protein E8E13_003915 [Curvularia kusanoi]
MDIPPTDTYLLTAASRTLPDISVTELESLASLHNTVVHRLSRTPDFFLPVGPPDHERLFSDTGILLALPSNHAYLIFHTLEDNKVKIAHYSKNLSPTDKDNLNAIAAYLSVREPDHVTNVLRLWQEVLGLKREGVSKGKIQQLGAVWKGIDGLGEVRGLVLRGREEMQ